MADNLTDAIENAVADALVGGTAVQSTAPISVRLMSANGDDTTAGTEVTGGSYAAQTVTFAAASGGSVASNADVTFTNMPTGDVVGIELWDATPTRIAYAPLASTKSLVLGDSLTFATGTITLTIS